MKVADTNKCGLPEWYSKFEKITIPCSLIELDEGFVDYLNRDKIILPKGWDYNNESSEIEYEEILTQVKAAIKRFNGNVFPKLNWSAPKDAIHMICNGTTLKCTHESDIIYLLKGSTFITHDLIAPYRSCIDFIDENKNPRIHLALKKYIEINPSFEFRCFVKKNKLIAISQRYGDIFDAEVKGNFKNYVERIKIFYLNEIYCEFDLNEYVFDVYVTDDKVLLIDFNPFSPDFTESALFDWKTLMDVDLQSDLLPLTLCVEHEQAVCHSSIEQYSLPLEVETILRGQQDNLFEYLQKAMENESDSSDADNAI